MPLHPATPDAPTPNAAPLTKDAEFRIPERANEPGATGASTLARTLLDLLAAGGHTITEPLYVEEELTDEHGRSTWKSLAMRVECTVGDRRVVMRFDHAGAGPDCWTVTVDDERQEVRELWGLAAPEQRNAIVYAAHLGLRN